MKMITVIIGAVIVSAAGFGGWLASQYYPSVKENQQPAMEQAGQVKFDELPLAREPLVSAIFFYYSETGLVREERTIAGNPLPVKMAETLLEEYVKGFPQALRGTAVRGVYRDTARVLYIDLSDDLRRNFEGDARYEYYFLKALYQTIVTNVPDVKDVQLLIEGREIESIGGHVSILSTIRDAVGL